MPQVLKIGLASSLVFGLAHKGIAPALLLQGVSGMMYCIVFLKCGGLQGKYVKALMATASLHASYNLIVAVV